MNRPFRIGCEVVSLNIVYPFIGTYEVLIQIIFRYEPNISIKNSQSSKRTP